MCWGLCSKLGIVFGGVVERGWGVAALQGALRLLGKTTVFSVVTLKTRRSQELLPGETRAFPSQLTSISPAFPLGRKGKKTWF